MTPMGGYFELTLGPLNRTPPGGLYLNTARNALEYVLRAKGYSKIYLPYYTCQVLRQPVTKLAIKVEFYAIDEMLEPDFDYSRIKQGEAFLYTNYFSLKNKFVVQLAKIIPGLIVDNAQAFFSPVIPDVDIFYSPRKFFGLPDGAILYTNQLLPGEFATDVSLDRVSHLLKRIDLGAEAGYRDFLENDKKLDNQEIRFMSPLTKYLLNAVDYKACAEKRTQNFKYLNQHLAALNVLDSSLLIEDGTFCYPLLIHDGAKYKAELIKRKIFVPTYWPDLNSMDPSSFEFNLVKNLICLPIDQRYDLSHMEAIIKTIKEIGK